jgi:hypothetical protein
MDQYVIKINYLRAIRRPCTFTCVWRVRTLNPLVVGSNPTGPTNQNNGLAQRVRPFVFLA